MAILYDGSVVVGTEVGLLRGACEPVAKFDLELLSTPDCAKGRKAPEHVC